MRCFHLIIHYVLPIFTLEKLERISHPIHRDKQPRLAHPIREPPAYPVFVTITGTRPIQMYSSIFNKVG
jgi:hypothetical protein